MNRRQFGSAIVAACLIPSRVSAREQKPQRILLRSSWQTENIGDIAHTPGMLALLEKYRPDAEVTLWPNPLTPDVEALLLRRFPKLRIASSRADQDEALEHCDFFLHGSGPSLVGAREVERARAIGKPYGVGGITLSDEGIEKHRELLSAAQFVFTRDTDSLKALKASGIKGPNMDFGPDATFALDLRDDAAADKLLKQHGLEPGKFLCAIPRLRWTPYWEIRPATSKPNPQKSAVNEAFADRDHAKLRAAIIAWVRETGQRVFLVPEMTYAVSRLRPLLFDPLPDDVKPRVAVLDRYWLTAEAASVYTKAAALASFELHSPIMAIANGTPAILLRQPTDTRKGQMWRDVGLNDWIFEIDDATGPEIARRVVEVGRDPAAARTLVAKAQTYANAKMKAMIAQIG